MKHSINDLFTMQVYRFPQSQHAAKAEVFVKYLTKQEFDALTINQAQQYKEEFLKTGQQHSRFSFH